MAGDLAGRVVVLFDLDLTLLDIPGNREIRARALDRASGVPGLLDRVDDEGRTDRWLIDEVVRLGLADHDGLWERYEAAYNAGLRAALEGSPPSALPGAADLLAALSDRHEPVALGISTGNLRVNAVTKLEHAGLGRYFTPLLGGFGDRHADRADIVHEGARACGHSSGDRLVVVGDTPHDVRAALDARAVSVAVATGHTPADGLSTAGAHAVLPDLRDTPSALAAILG